MTDIKARPFGEYGFAIRTFWVKCTGLTVSRRWVNRYIRELHTWHNYIGEAS